MELFDTLLEANVLSELLVHFGIHAIASSTSSQMTNIATTSNTAATDTIKSDPAADKQLAWKAEKHSKLQSLNSIICRSLSK